MKLFYFFLLFFFPSLLFGQQMVVRDIKSFGAKGDGKTNDHEAFQRAAAFFNERGGNGRLVISKGVYIVGKQDFNPNTSKPVYYSTDALALVGVKNLRIEGQKGATIKYDNGLRFGAFDFKTGQPYIHGNNFFADGKSLAIPGSAISLRNCSNIVIQNLTFNGNNDSLILGGVYGDTGFQVPHDGIFIINSTSVTINQVNARHFGRDGMMVGNNTGDSSKPDKINVTNSVFEYNGRQGFSWIGGNGITFSNCKLNHNGRGRISSMPKSGMDIESEVGPIKNGKFDSCEFIDNAGCGVVADSGPSSNCTFNNCTFWGVTNWALWITKPGYTITNSRIFGSFVHGYSANTDAEATVFRNCQFEDKPYNGQDPFGNFLIESNGRKRVLFENCTMIAHKKKIVWMETSTALKPEEKYQLINCRLVFEGGSYPQDRWVSLTRSITYKDCTFEIKSQDPNAKNFFFNGIGAPYNVDLGGNKFIINNEEVKH